MTDTPTEIQDQREHVEYLESIAQDAQVNLECARAELARLEAQVLPLRALQAARQILAPMTHYHWRRMSEGRTSSYNEALAKLGIDIDIDDTPYQVYTLLAKAIEAIEATND